MQLQTALKMIDHSGAGVVVYLRQEGRGIGLVNKLKAYMLQDQGLDTVEANEKLGFPADLRNYGVGAQILNDLGVKQFRLITNNPRKIAGLKGYGLEMVDRVPLLIEATDYNSAYLATKAQKLGHWLLQTYLVTVALEWKDPNPSLTQRYEWLEKLRYWAAQENLLLQEETRPVAIALFTHPSLIVHLGFDQPYGNPMEWYHDPEHPYSQAIASWLDLLLHWSPVQRLEFLVSDGSDPLDGLQLKLQRQPCDPQTSSPSSLFERLETQKIYTFKFPE
jgi:3,4-dihydroxy 2-butanone 4-phosphate synthase/GTP cyclohydrolase II